MTIKRNEEFGGHDIICDECGSVFSSEEDETVQEIIDDLKMNGWRVENDKHICFRCTG